VGRRWADRLLLGEVEAVELHDLGPSGDEVLEELLLGVGARVDFRPCERIRIRRLERERSQQQGGDEGEGGFYGISDLWGFLPKALTSSRVGGVWRLRVAARTRPLISLGVAGFMRRDGQVDGPGR